MSPTSAKARTDTSMPTRKMGCFWLGRSRSKQENPRHEYRRTCGLRWEKEKTSGFHLMTGRTPLWFVRLEDEICRRIECVVALYSENETRLVLWNLTRAIHRRAREMDPSESWLALAIEGCGVQSCDIPDTSYPRICARADVHPSYGDAEDVAEDISLLMTPEPQHSARVSSCAGVHIIWTRFANRLNVPDRALLAAEAVALA